MCAKAGKQLMYYKDWFDNKSRLAINDILIMSNFSYCTVMWIISSKPILPNSKIYNEELRES